MGGIEVEKGWKQLKNLPNIFDNLQCKIETYQHRPVDLARRLAMHPDNPSPCCSQTERALSACIYLVNIMKEQGIYLVNDK